MGKASKWLKNFLLGKKYVKENKESALSPSTYPETSTEIVPSAPRVRRRWSFGRLKGKEIFRHKLCKSLDAMDVSILPVELMIAYARTRNVKFCVALAEPHDDFRGRAATKIQAFFRSFLAKKALCALRGLVKIQALVRGHLVRKQTTATLRCMHSLVAIQVRARVQRIQMAEDEQAIMTKQASMHRRVPQERVSNTETTLYPSRLREMHLAIHSSLRHSSSKALTCPEERIGDSIFYRAADHVNKISDEQQPSYMSYTKSSKAKKRAHSEPKQRPYSLTNDQKGRKSVYTEGKGVYPYTGKRSDQKNGLIKDFQSAVSTAKCYSGSRFLGNYEVI